MTTIDVNYGALAGGHDGLVATWARVEAHLADLTAAVAAAGDMRSDALMAYTRLKAHWDSAAQDRQQVLRALAQALDRAGTQYRQADAAAAAQFGM